MTPRPCARRRCRPRRAGRSARPGSPRRSPSVDRLDRHALGQQQAGLVDVGRQDAVDPEAGAVVDHDHRLAHPASEAHRRGDRLRRGGVRWGSPPAAASCRPARRSACRAPARAAGPRRRSGDRDGGGVGGEDRVRPRHRLDLREHPALEREVLEHRLDHQVGAAEPARSRRCRRAARSAARTAAG